MPKANLEVKKKKLVRPFIDLYNNRYPGQDEIRRNIKKE